MSCCFQIPSETNEIYCFYKITLSGYSVDRKSDVDDIFRANFFFLVLTSLEKPPKKL